MNNDEKLSNCDCSEEKGCCCGHDHDAEDNCECGCMEDDEALVVDLEDENGNVVSCEVVDQFQYKDKPYVLVQNPDDGAFYLFKISGEEENEELVIPDDDEFEEVSAYYEELIKKEIDKKGVVA